MDVPFDKLVPMLALALLAYAAVTCTLSTLAARLQGQKYRHTLVVESRRRRQAYLASLAGTEPSEPVDVVEETPPADERQAA
jgi:tRNA A37 threonylcarbamoyladenosine modification protein TsaB